MPLRSLFNPFSQDWWERHFLQVALFSLALALLATHTWLWHYEFLLHLAAVMLELFLTITIVASYLKAQEQRRQERTEYKVRELVFRVSLSDLVYHALRVTQRPALSLKRLQTADAAALKDLLERVRSQAFSVDLSGKEWPAFLQALLEAEPSLQKVLERERAGDGAYFFECLLSLLHGIHDVRLAARRGGPDRLHELMQQDPRVKRQVRSVVQSVLVLFLQYLLDSKQRRAKRAARLLRELRELAYFKGYEQEPA